MKLNRKKLKLKDRKIKAIKKTTRPIHHREIAGIVKHFINEALPNKIEAFLLARGVAPCVAREWAGEPAKRIHATAFRMKKAFRKAASAFGARGAFGRRILSSDTYVSRFWPDGRVTKRIIEQHATKGARTYRLAAS